MSLANALVPMKLRLGTRGSPLALAQAEIVRSALCKSHGWPDDAISVTVIKTSGDKTMKPLVDIGGKGLFTKELEEAPLDSRIDFAVHSAKDVPSLLDERFELSAFLEREDPRDVLISNKANALRDLPARARIGTSSPRRRAQLLSLRPDFAILDFRGNVGTRLAKLANGEADATILAAAGLNRLRQPDVIANFIAVEEMIPAAGQGAIALEIRRGDEATAAALKPLDHRLTSLSVIAERAVLAALEGSCRTPIAAHAQIANSELALSAMLAQSDGRRSLNATIKGPSSDAKALGDEVGRKLKADAPADWIS